MFILKVIHWFIIIMLVASSLLPKRFITYAFVFQIGVMLSWLLTGRCVLWDLQKKVDPTIDIKKDTTSEMLGIDRYTWLLITHTIIYINTLYLGYRLYKLYETKMFIIAYILLNGQYLHKGDDDLSKY